MQIFKLQRNGYKNIEIKDSNRLENGHILGYREYFHGEKIAEESF